MCFDGDHWLSTFFYIPYIYLLLILETKRNEWEEKEKEKEEEEKVEKAQWIMKRDKKIQMKKKRKTKQEID